MEKSIAIYSFEVGRSGSTNLSNFTFFDSYRSWEWLTWVVEGVGKNLCRFDISLDFVKILSFIFIWI